MSMMGFGFEKPSSKITMTTEATTNKQSAGVHWTRNRSWLLRYRLGLSKSKADCHLNGNFHLIVFLLGFSQIGAGGREGFEKPFSRFGYLRTHVALLHCDVLLSASWIKMPRKSRVRQSVCYTILHNNRPKSLCRPGNLLIPDNN